MKTVCVIGAGASGLTTIKQLLDEGHAPTCYEKESDLGGVFNFGQDKNGVYDNTVLTISNYLMAFSDDPPQGHRYHWHHREYKDYLLNYARKFGLDAHITFNTTVAHVERIDGEYFVTTQNVKTGEEKTERFDALAVCTGTHQIARMPHFPGLSEFSGQVIHGSQYKNSEPFRDRKVVCVGIGESAADIVREICQVAESCHLAIRSYPVLIPRVLNESSSDGYTTRMLHALKQPSEGFFFFALGALITRLIQIRDVISGWFGHSDKEQPTLDPFHQPLTPKMLDLNTPYEEESLKLIKAWSVLSGGLRFLTKNVTFVPYIIDGQIQVIASEIEAIDNDVIRFKDGRTVVADTLVLCTGYQDDFAFLNQVRPQDDNVRNLFMQAIHPDYPDCAYIGWARPTTGGIPACSEMAARYFALLLSGKVKLPQNVQERVEEDKAHYAEAIANSSDLTSIIAWKRYMDGMAELIGCQVTLFKYLLKPRLLYKLLYATMIPSQFRLTGPHSDYQLAQKTILSLPVSFPHSLRMWTAISATRLKLNRLPEDELLYFYNTEYFPERILTKEEINRYRFDLPFNGQVTTTAEEVLLSEEKVPA